MVVAYPVCFNIEIIFYMELFVFFLGGKLRALVKQARSLSGIWDLEVR